MKVLAKNIRMNLDIYADVGRVVDAYLNKWGQEPPAILLGPNEYLSFVKKTCAHAGVETTLDRQMRFRGILVMGCARAGIDVAVDPNFLFHYAIGEVREVTSVEDLNDA